MKTYREYIGGMSITVAIIIVALIAVGAFFLGRSVKKNPVPAPEITLDQNDNEHTPSLPDGNFGYGYFNNNTQEPEIPFPTSDNQASNCTPSSPSSITVVSPNGGEIFDQQEQILVIWESCNLASGDELVIDLFNGNDPLSGNCILKSTLNTGQEMVVLDPTHCRYLNFVSGENFEIRVYKPSGGTQDLSDSLFTIN